MLAVCCLSLFMVGLDNTIVNVGLPSIGKTLHASIAGLQWTIASYTIVLAGLLMFSGAIADRIGRRTLFQVGLSLFTLGSWLCSLAPSLGWLIAFRVLQGIGGSMLNPSALSIITNTFTHPAERARAIGIWDGVFGLSMALGPVLGGVLISSVGWRGIFWANIPVGLAAISLTALFVPDSRSPRTRRIDPVGQVLIIIMLTSLAYAIIQGPGDGWLSPEIFGLFALSAGTLGVLLAYEPRRAEPALDFRFFRSVPFAGANLTAICAIAATAGFLFLSTLYLQDVRGFSALQTGLTLLPMPIVMAVCAPLAGRIMARSGPRVPLVIAGAALTLSSAGLSRLTGATSPEYIAVDLRPVRRRHRHGQLADHQRRHVRRPEDPGGRGLRHQLLKPPARPVPRRRRRRLGPGSQHPRQHAIRLHPRRPRWLVGHGGLRLRRPAHGRGLHLAVGQGDRHPARRVTTARPSQSMPKPKHAEAKARRGHRRRSAICRNARTSTIVRWRWPVRMNPRTRQLPSARVTVAREMPSRLAISS